jgi:hypothetical protein
MKEAEIDKKKASKSYLRALRGLWMIFCDSLAYGSSLIKSHQPFLELLIVIAVCNINGTNAAIKTTRRCKFQICFHGSDSFLELLKLTAFKIGSIVENMVINLSPLRFIEDDTYMIGKKCSRRRSAPLNETARLQISCDSSRL